LNEIILSLYFYGEKLYICGFAEILCPQKTLGPQIAKDISSANPQNATFAGCPQILKKVVRKFADLQFAERFIFLNHV
jgi:hypothetical protein